MYGTESPVSAGVAVLGWIHCDHLFFQPGLCLVSYGELVAF